MIEGSPNAAALHYTSITRGLTMSRRYVAPEPAHPYLMSDVRRSPSRHGWAPRHPSGGSSALLWSFGI